MSGVSNERSDVVDGVGSVMLLSDDECGESGGFCAQRKGIPYIGTDACVYAAIEISLIVCLDWGSTLNEPKVRLGSQVQRTQCKDKDVPHT